MIILDVRKKGKKLTLKDCAEMYKALEDSAVRYTELDSIGRIIIIADEVWVTQWQADNIFSSLGGQWKFWRGIAIKVMQMP